jgi:hypothetical protein
VPDKRPCHRFTRLAAPTFLVALILFAGVGPAAGMTRKSDSLTPGKPTNLVAVTQVTSAQLSWAAGSGWVASFYVYRNGDRVATLSARLHSYTFSGLSPSSRYTLGVAAHDSHGTSSISSVTVLTAALSPPTGNPFGVGFYDVATNQAIDLALQVHATYFRNTAFLLTPGGYQHDPAVVRAAGLEQILNVHYAIEPESGPPGPSSFPKDLADYRARIARAINDVRPVLIVVENEASWDGHFSGTAEQYGQMLAAAVAVGRSKGIPVATDGVISRTVVAWVYSGLVDAGKTAEAESFWALAAETGQTKPRSTSSRDAWFSAYLAGDPDYVNIHFYWSEPTSLLTARDYLERAFGRPVLVGEWGIRSVDPSLMIRLMDVLSQRDYAQLWSRDTGDGTQSLFASNGTLRPIGEAFRDYITGHYLL